MFSAYIAIPLVTIVVSGLVHLILYLIKGILLPLFSPNSTLPVTCYWFFIVILCFFFYSYEIDC